MKKPLVSVIIPNYNHARFLDERIQSVLHQTYQHFEVIILDDLSTDNSVEVINKYKDDPHVSNIVVNEQNSGSSFKQWHKGFELAKGEIVWIAESDDSCDEKLLETLVGGYVENDAVLAFCRSCMYDVEGNKSYYGHQDQLSKSVSFSGKDFICRYMIDRNMVANASSAIFNREVAMSLDSQYMSMRGEGDWLFWIELMEYGNVFFATETLNMFRFHDSNTTMKLTYEGISPLEHKIVYNYLLRNGYISPSDAFKERVRCLYYYYYTDYESNSVRRKVLNSWDRNRLGRLYMLGCLLKTAGKLMLTGLW